MHAAGKAPAKADLERFAPALTAWLRGCPAGYPKQTDVMAVLAELQRKHIIFGIQSKASLTKLIADAADMWRIRV